MSLTAALLALWESSARPEREEDDDVLGVLVRMVLAQATSKPNASAAFGELLDRFGGDWARVEAASTEEVADAIAIGGLANQKAPRIQAILLAARSRFGAHTLEPLRDWPTAEALEFVSALPGVGPTTARFTLMVAAGHDLFPVNGGIARVLTRLGVVAGAQSSAKIHAAAAAALPEGWGYAAHMTLVRHARAVCTTKAPDCGACAAQPHCAYRSVDGG